MKITKRFNRVIKPLKPINCSNSKPKPHIVKSDPILNPKSKPKPKRRTIKKKSITQSDVKLEDLKHTFLLEKPPKILSLDFYQIDALELAPQLLGKYLKKDDVVLQITEVEAYRSNDSACHGRVGVTSRTAPLFGSGGHAYVYLCYGMHNMLNVVADKEGIGSAVLIRSCAPISGLDTIKQRRGLDTEKPVLLTGPGKVGQALGLSTEWSTHALFTPGGLELLEGPEVKEIVVGPRVGIDYALPEHVSALWRFAIAGSPWISAPKNTLRPPLSPG
ncbi:DNA-3-methyladenine glycosylase-like [Rutidosis leptorrhynchoides]|uniref:DNA-3-methyladenine glycosylase-like n=1 Tax=Rutidosis leptorrhynchoides TaxID=125765 RepID=UPI003A99D795